MRLGFFVIAFISLIRTVLADSSTNSTVYSCEYEVRNGSTSGSASIELRGGLIHKVSFNNFFVGLPGRLGYSCVLEVSRDDKETKWKDNGDEVEVEFPDAQQYAGGNSMTLSITADGFLIDMSNTRSSGNCGAGAELPEKIVFPFS
jgi:hypothetical protein